MLLRSLFSTILCFLFIANGSAQTVAVGSASYTKTFPGVDAAARNSYPTGSPLLSGNAVGKPVPTNDWWSAKLKNDHVSNLFSYPITMKTVNSGLVMTYIPWGVVDDYEPITMGVSSLNASKATVSDYTDWTVTMDWASGSNNFTATMGIAMPFVYFTKATNDVAQVKISKGNVSVSGEMIVVEDAHRGGSFAIYAPTGSTWTKNGEFYTSTLNGKNYWSAALLPQGATASTAANKMKKYAYAFPQTTAVVWNYDESKSVLKTDFNVSVEVKEGTNDKVLMGLLPHQWSHLASSPSLTVVDKYTSIRGEIKMIEGNAFSVENTFYGILPTLPYIDNYSAGFDPSLLNAKIASIENDGLATWTDSYNEGQVMNRLIQTARIADLMGNTESRDKMVATVKERLEDWLSYESGEVAFLFYYNDNWTSLIGYPAGHGQDGNLNDHHFHWGYFIHAAAFMEQYEPGWADQWGDMIDLLIRDAASHLRNDDKFPFLRNFSPYAGHCWANGFASFPQGNDQESTSESMQFNSSLIHWGSITGNDDIRDLGIYLYTTEQSAVEEYWFDMDERIFPDNQFSLVSRVWGNSYDNGTFWTADIAASYGIEMYPIHGGSLYLGHNHAYVEKLWDEITKNTGILQNEENPNLWHDVMWKYLAFIDPAQAIDLYDNYSVRNLKFGISDAQTYHWLHAMNALGQVDASITADYPVAAVFNNNGEKIYTAHNYTAENLTVTFSDGFKLQLAPNVMATNKDVDVEANITSSFAAAYEQGSVDLTVEVVKGNVSKVVFYDGTDSVGVKSSAPYALMADNLALGVHKFYAKIYDGELYGTTNIVSVLVGEQTPYSGSAVLIPGEIEPGKYDAYAGGNGQGIAYYDVSINNEGDFRSEEYVDATEVNGEGATVGWISSGEWMEYTISAEQTGLYDLAVRYACGNNTGGGKFHFEVNGKAISTPITLGTTAKWDVWATKNVSGIPLIKGEKVLRLVVDNGDFNLGKLSFSFKENLPYHQPIADAGANVKVLWPMTKTNLDATKTVNPGNESLSYEWTQLYGPSVASFDNKNAPQPEISALVEGIYSFNLNVSNGTYEDNDKVMVIVSEDENVAPTVAMTSPSNNASFQENTNITMSAAANDIDGSVQKVEFYNGTTLIGTATEQPFQITWSAAEGVYTIFAKATDNKGAVTSSEAIIINFLGSNVALNKTVVTSTNENAGTAGSNAVDGDLGTRWSSLFADPQWLYVDLGEAYNIKQVILKWEAAFGSKYDTQVSNDATTWSTVYTENASDGETDELSISATGRYVRMYGKERATPYGYSLYEMEVYGSKSGSSNINNERATPVSVYPNPSDGLLSFSQMLTNVEVYSLTGQRVIRAANGKVNSIDISALSAGSYILKGDLEGAQMVIRIIKK